MEITIFNSYLYFKLFYLLAFVFVFVMVVVKGQKHGYKLRTLLLMLTTISVFTVIGSRLFTIPVSEWLHVINSESYVQYGNRSAIGGLLFGLIGLLLCQRVFRFGRPIFDLYAWIVPISLGIQKIGCFINGCCYGKPSELVWSVKYPKGSHAHYNEWLANGIDMNAPFSLSIHPVQLYETIGLILIGYFVWSSKHKWQKQASALIFSLFLFFSFRFLMEFIRDPASSQFNENYLLGIRTFQWAILITALILGLIFLWYERHLKNEVFKIRKDSIALEVELVIIASISTVVYFLNALFSGYELLVIWIKFIPAIILSIVHVYTHGYKKQYRIIGYMIFILPLFVMAQTSQRDSIQSTTYNKIDIGASFGDFINEIMYNPQAGNCGGTSYSSEYYKNEYTIGGVGYSRVKVKGDRERILGTNLHFGNITSIRLSDNQKETEFIYGVNPYFKSEGKWLGIGFGFQAGKFKKNTDEELDVSNVEDAKKDYHIQPEFYIRLGRRDILDIDYNYGYLFPSPYPTAYSRVSLGSGFGKKNDYSLRFGKVFPIDSNFISAEGLINENIGLSFTYIFNEKHDRDFGGEFDTSGKLLFGVNYRFGFKKE